MFVLLIFGASTQHPASRPRWACSSRSTPSRKIARDARNHTAQTIQTNIVQTMERIVGMVEKIMQEDEDNLVKVKLSIPSNISLVYR